MLHVVNQFDLYSSLILLLLADIQERSDVIQIALQLDGHERLILGFGYMVKQLNISINLEVAANCCPLFIHVVCTDLLPLILMLKSCSGGLCVICTALNR